MTDIESETYKSNQEALLLKRLKELSEKPETSGWIETIYKSRSDRLISENDKIWTTGRIFIPISVGVFGVYATIDTPKLSQVSILATISISLLLIWQAISFVHKKFQTTHSDWLERIEKVVWLETPKKKETFLERIIKLGRIRGLLIITIIIIWSIIILSHPNFNCF